MMDWNRTFLAIHAPTLEAFRAIFAPGMDTMTGKWGWDRSAGCINLNACRFQTKAEAEADRDRAFANPDSYPDFSR